MSHYTNTNWKLILSFAFWKERNVRGFILVVVIWGFVVAVVVGLRLSVEGEKVVHLESYGY